MTSKKNGFLRFIFSLVPGAGEMYMGFMKMGVSLMSIFFVLVAIGSFIEIGPLIFVAFIVWFYSFFHAHNLAGLPDEEFYAVEDEYLFLPNDLEGKGRELLKTYRRLIAVVLIVMGVVMVWKGVFRAIADHLPEYLMDIIYGINYYVPQMVVGIVIIVLGVYMIRGKKEQLDTQAENGEGQSDGK